MMRDFLLSIMGRDDLTLGVRSFADRTRGCASKCCVLLNPISISARCATVHSSTKPSGLSCRNLKDNLRGESEEEHPGENLHWGASHLAQSRS